MLGKLFKYEFRSLGRTLLPVYGAVLVMSIVSALFQKISPMSALSTLAPVKIASAISMVLYSCLIFTSLAMSLVFAVSRYKKNIHETEGYLTNTLPVSTHSLISTKLVTAMVYQILGVVAAALSGLIFAVVVSGIKNLDLADLFRFIGKVFAKYGADSVLYTVEAILLALVTCAAVNLMFYAAISVGYSFNGKKTTYSVLVFIGFYIVEQIISTNAVRIITRFFEPDFSTGVGAMHPYLILAIFLDAVFCVVYFALSDYFVSHRLNLQ